MLKKLQEFFFVLFICLASSKFKRQKKGDVSVMTAAEIIMYLHYDISRFCSPLEMSGLPPFKIKNI